jgi:hypothetical protein
VGKNARDGNLVLVCKRVGQHYRWEQFVAPPVRSTTTTTRAVVTTTTTATPTLYSPAGNLYRAGEFCPAKDLGMLDHGSTGIIKCVDDNGYDRWVYA